MTAFEGYCATDCKINTTGIRDEMGQKYLSEQACISLNQALEERVNGLTEQPKFEVCGQMAEVMLKGLGVDEEVITQARAVE